MSWAQGCSSGSGGWKSRTLTWPATAGASADNTNSSHSLSTTPERGERHGGPLGGHAGEQRYIGRNVNAQTTPEHRPDNGVGRGRGDAKDGPWAAWGKSTP
eukprot:scaffold4827_cov109-Isochrysis_galbana.AAC.5